MGGTSKQPVPTGCEFLTPTYKLHLQEEARGAKREQGECKRWTQLQGTELGMLSSIPPRVMREHFRYTGIMKSLLRSKF